MLFKEFQLACEKKAFDYVAIFPFRDGAFGLQAVGYQVGDSVLESSRGGARTFSTLRSVQRVLADAGYSGKVLLELSEDSP